MVSFTPSVAFGPKSRSGRSGKERKNASAGNRSPVVQSSLATILSECVSKSLSQHLSFPALRVKFWKSLLYPLLQDL